MGKVGKRIPPPLSTLNLLVTLSNALMGIVDSQVGSPNHDLCAQWSIIAASETCLYPKSYLISGWVRPHTGDKYLFADQVYVKQTASKWKKTSPVITLQMLGFFRIY